MYQRLQIMSVFASRARPGANKKVGLVRVRLETVERVKEVLEHLLLYIGLAIYTAIGAKVETFLVLWKSCDCVWFKWRGKLGIICCEIFNDRQKILGQQ